MYLWKGYCMNISTIDEILSKHFNYALQDIVSPNEVSMVPSEHIINAKQALYDYLAARLPEKQPDPGSKDPYTISLNEAFDDAFALGWTAALKQVESMLAKELGGKD